MQIYSNSYMVKLLWTRKFPWTNNNIIMVLRFNVSSELLTAAQPWQIASTFDNTEMKLLIFLSAPTKSWSVIAWQSYGRKRKINIQVSKYQFQFYKRVTLLALSLEMILRHSCLK